MKYDIEDIKTPFEMICYIAKTQNAPLLIREMMAGVSVDIMQDEQTPVSFLAKEGNTEAVEFLLKFGANINFAAWGYGRGGYINLVQNLVMRGANTYDAARACETTTVSKRQHCLNFFNYTSSDTIQRSKIIKDIEQRSRVDAELFVDRRFW